MLINLHIENIYKQVYPFSTKVSLKCSSQGGGDYGGKVHKGSLKRFNRRKKSW